MRPDLVQAAVMARPVRRARFVRDERGVSLMVAMMVTFAVFSLGTVWVGVATHQADGSAIDRRREQSFAAAEAGVNNAMSHLAADASYTGAATSALANGAGEWETTVTAVNAADPTDFRRYIVSKGYAPSKTAPQRVARRLEEQVDLVANDSFRRALFAAPNGITASNNTTITGDVYSAANLTLTSNTKVFGRITSQGTVATGNTSTVGGDISALGNVTIADSGTTVSGNVYAGGVGYANANVTMSGCVMGTVQASGTITGSSPAGCAVNWAQHSPPVAPRVESLPTFTWNPANYAASTTFATATAWNNYFNGSAIPLVLAHKGALAGVFKVTCSGSTITLTAFTMSGDVTLVTDCPVVINGGISNSSGTTANLIIISSTATSPAVSLTSSVSTVANSVHLLLYANNASIQFTNLKNFSGAVYGKSITLDQQFTLTWVPMTPPGFTWTSSANGRYVIVTRDFKEVSFY